MSRVKAALAAGLLVCLAVQPAFAGGHSGGNSSSSGSYHPTVYTYYENGGYHAIPLRRTIEAELQVELTDAPPTATEGEMAPGDVIARHVLRALDARILTEPAQGRSAELPAGTALARVTTEGGKGIVLWCALAGAGRAGFTSIILHDCFADSSGPHQIGRFDQVWAVGSSGRLLLGDNAAVSHARLPKFAAYREARPEERPTALLGYRWCDGDGTSEPPHFALAVNVPGDSAWLSGDKRAGCVFGVWSDPADKTRVNVDGHALSVTSAKPRLLGYRFSGRIAAAERLAPLKPGESVRAAAAAPAEPVVAEAPPPPPPPPPPSPELKPLVAGGAPPVVTSGLIAPGQSFFTVGVRHAVTGVLKHEVIAHGFFGDRSLPAAQPVYALRTGAEAETIWCAPRQLPGGDAGRQTHWVGVCMPHGFWVEIRPAMMSADVSWPSNYPLASPPEVERGPVQLPPMVLSYAFGGWTKQGWLVINVQLDWGEGPQLLRAITIPIGPDGASLRVMGGEVVVSVAPKAKGQDVAQASVQVKSPPKPDAAIAY